MNIELTALEAGSLVFFSISIVGVVMALKRRAMRKKKDKIKSDVVEYEFKSNPETLAPEKIPKQSEPAEKPVLTKDQDQLDVDKLLDSLKKDERD